MKSSVYFQALRLWHTGCDSDWGEGYSTCEFVETDRGTALFRGKISTQVVKVCDTFILFVHKISSNELIFYLIVVKYNKNANIFHLEKKNFSLEEIFLNL